MTRTTEAVLVAAAAIRYYEGRKLTPQQEAARNGMRILLNRLAPAQRPHGLELTVATMMGR